MDNEKESINPLKGEDKYTIYFFLKVSILTLVFSVVRLFLFPQERASYNDHHNESDTPGTPSEREQTATSSKEVDTLIKVIVDESLAPAEHNAPYFSNPQQRLNEICSEYADICDITTRDGNYTDREKLMYQAIVIYMFNVLNDYLYTTIQDDIKYVKLYEDGSSGSRRGSATASYVKMNTKIIDSPEEFWQVLTHELGHTIDFSVIEGYAKRKDTVYTEFGKPRWSVDDPSIDYYRISWLNESTRRSDANFRDFVSGYGMRGMYEDLAEFNNLWLNHHAYLKTLARNNPVIEEKYRYFRELYGRNYFKDTYTSYPEAGERIWDTTQIFDY